MKKAGILVFVMMMVLSARVCSSETISNSAEFFLYSDTKEAAGRTDFFSGGTKGWGTENRVDYLRNYADFLKGYYGGLKLDEYRTSIDEVNDVIKNLKPQPEPGIRRKTRLSEWRWALGDDGEKNGWESKDFDDSSWNKTEAMPLVITGEETRDLWMRTTVRTGEYEKAFIDFESVLGNSRIYVNGKKVVGPKACNTSSAPFRVDLTTWLEKNADNQITVHVEDFKMRGRSSSPNKSSKLIGWGFMGRVHLVQTGRIFIDNIFAFTEQLGDSEAQMQIRFELNNYQTVDFDGTAEVTLTKWFPVEAGGPAATKTFDLTIPAGSGTDSPDYLALDFGSDESPLEPGYVRFTPDTIYDSEKGYGWKSNNSLKAVDSDEVGFVEYINTDLKRDAIEADRPHYFMMDTDPGTWTFELNIGSPDHDSSAEIEYIDKTILSYNKGDGYDRWEYGIVNITQFIRGSMAKLKIMPIKRGKVFTINSLVAMNKVPWKQRFQKPLVIENPDLWEPGAPNLYKLRMVIRDADGNEVDDIVTTMGVFKVEDRYGDLYLNNRRYRLRGVLETHSFPPEPDSDIRCISPPDRWIVQDILDNRRGNMNIMRFHPAEGLGTNYQRWLEYGDQIGMFFMWSPREWLHWGHHGPQSFLPKLEANLESSVIISRNHPSIFAWEGANETYYNAGRWDKRAKQFCDEFYYRVNALDPSRFILPVSFWYAQFEGKTSFYKIDPNRGNEVSYPGQGKSPISFWAPNVFWDVHPYPGWYGSWAEIWWGAGSGDKYVKDKVMFVSEFGAEGMPNWELYKDETFYHVWEESGSKAAEHEQHRIGRILDFDEFEISQAYQALVMYNDIAVFRTEDVDGLMICTGAEGRHNGRYFKGIRDMYRRPKLAYYVTGSAYQDVFVSGLNGDTALNGTDELSPVIVNEGAARRVDIEAVFREVGGAAVYTGKIEGIDVPGYDKIKIEERIKPEGLKDGKYYSIEYTVKAAD